MTSICLSIDPDIVKDTLGVLEGINLVTMLDDKYYQWIGLTGVTKLIEILAAGNSAVDPDTQYGQLSRFVLEYLIQQKTNLVESELRRHTKDKLALNGKLLGFIKSKILKIFSEI